MWADTPATTDCLGFSAYVDALAEIITKPAITPVTVGVFGDWGSGKTSLMRMLRKHLDGSPSGNVTVWFNPWQFEDKEAVQTALIHTILDEFEKRKSLCDEAKGVIKELVSGASVLKLAKVFTKTALTLTPDVAGLLECFSDPKRRPATAMREFHEHFERLLRLETVQRLVVFIDDLDRCHADMALELFEATHLFLASERCVFVIGADAQKLSAAVRQRYPDEVGQAGIAKDYFEKVIQIPFHIPPQSLNDIDVYLHFLVIANHVRQEQVEDLREALFGARSRSEAITQAASGWLATHGNALDVDIAMVQADLKAVVPHLATIAAGLKGIPRQIKRFLNILSMRRTLAAKNRLTVEPAILVKLLVLEYRWREIFEEVVKSFDRGTGRSLLLDALCSVYMGKRNEDEEESDLVRRAIPTPGLRSFLLAEADISSVDLSPYLFLAQTSIAVAGPVPIASASALVQEVVGGISSSDPYLVSAAVIRAKALDAASVQIAVERCAPTMFDPDARRATQTIKGIDGLLAQVPAAVGAVLELLSKNDVLAGGPLLAAAALLEKQARIHESGPLAERLREVKAKYAERAPSALKPLVQADTRGKKGAARKE